MPTWTPMRVDHRHLARDEGAERGVDTVLALAEQGLAGELEQDPAVAKPAVGGAAPALARLAGRCRLGHSSSPSAKRTKRRTRMFSPIVAILSVTRSTDRAVLVAERLLEEADLAVPLPELPVDDLLADGLGLRLRRPHRRAAPPSWPPATSAGIRSMSTYDRRQARDLHGEVPDELLELVRARDEVRLAVDLDQDADAAAGVDVAADEALAGVAAGLLGGRRETLLAEQRDGLVEVAAGLLQCALAVHEPGPGALAQLLDLPRP